ncbi:MAG: TIGR01777 family oxidoreductase [Flavobacteriales bacterium]|nr:TIGR01777 family oxidoreductase [Flavobacteriales bacterium]MDW8431656.1 TIGR01777 family oxidoreductase [Flavobacteriales bacterium]
MRILIAGGSGLVGRALIRKIRQESFWEVAVLTRNPSAGLADVRKFYWNPASGEWDPALSEWPADALVNLAGENVGAGSWTPARRAVLLQSRLEALDTLARLAGVWSRRPRVISMSASGYYGHVPGTQLVSETHPPGKDFLAHVCVAWESKAFELFGNPEHHLLIFRLGVVLDSQEGALPRMLQPVRFAFGQPLGCGRQRIPWIHIEDVANSLLMALKRPEIQGVFNLAAPESVSNAEFIKTLCQAAGRFFVPIPVPAIALRLLLGDQADLILKGVAMDITRWSETGFRFAYPNLRPALNHLISNS